MRYFIEPACGTIERDEYETRGEPAARVAFSQEREEVELLMATLLPGLKVFIKNAKFGIFILYNIRHLDILRPGDWN